MHSKPTRTAAIALMLCAWSSLACMCSPGSGPFYSEEPAPESVSFYLTAGEDGEVGELARPLVLGGHQDVFVLARDDLGQRAEASIDSVRSSNPEVLTAELRLGGEVRIEALAQGDAELLVEASTVHSSLGRIEEELSTTFTISVPEVTRIDLESCDPEGGLTVYTPGALATWRYAYRDAIGVKMQGALSPFDPEAIAPFSLVGVEGDVVTLAAPSTPGTHTATTRFDPQTFELRVIDSGEVDNVVTLPADGIVYMDRPNPAKFYAAPMVGGTMVCGGGPIDYVLDEVDSIRCSVAMPDEVHQFVEIGPTGQLSGLLDLAAHREGKCEIDVLLTGGDLEPIRLRYDIIFE